MVYRAEQRGIIADGVKRGSGAAEAWPEGLRVAALAEEIRMGDTSEEDG